MNDQIPAGLLVLGWLSIITLWQACRVVDLEIALSEYRITQLEDL